MSTPMLLAKVAVLTGTRLLPRDFLVQEATFALAVRSFLSISAGLTWRLGGFLKLFNILESFDRVP